MTKKEVFRVVSRGTDGQIRLKDYPSENSLMDLHTQIGVDDCSTDLTLRGLPVFRGLIGPMAEDSKTVRYESPEVFEALTKDWIAEGAHKKRRRRRSSAPSEAKVAIAEASSDEVIPANVAEV